MKKNILLLLSLLCTLVSFSQNSQNRTFDASIKTTGLAGTNDNLPFWFTHNQLGKYSTSAQWQELTEGQFSGALPISRKLELSYGADIALLVTENETKAKIIQGWAGLSGKTLSIKAGFFADDEILGGLSSSNGNIARSLNYRPYPMVRISTSGYIPFLFAKKWLRVKAEYDEGMLLDSRILDNPHIHNDLLGCQILASSSFRLSFEINRHVFWGGNSPTNGQQPDDFGSYFRYILGMKGNSKFLETDQENTSGNQLGSYMLSAEKDMENCKLQIRISHPFEDGSGMEFINFRDNIYSLYVSKNEKGSLLDECLFEYVYSKHQSGSDTEKSGRWRYPKGRDNYFNHSVYQSGFTYFGYCMGTPLFSPLVTNSDGTIAGVGNNRISAFHAGAKGFLAKQVSWKAMLTYSRNFGTYATPYDPVRKQFCSLAELNWRSKNHPFDISVLLAADSGNLSGNHIGAGLSFKWQLK